MERDVATKDERTVYFIPEIHERKWSSDFLVNTSEKWESTRNSMSSTAQTLFNVAHTTRFEVDSCWRTARGLI